MQRIAAATAGGMGWSEKGEEQGKEVPTAARSITSVNIQRHSPALPGYIKDQLEVRE